MPMPENVPTYAVVGVVVLGFVTVLPLGAAVLFIGSWVGRVQNVATTNETEMKMIRERLHDMSNQFSAYQQKVAIEYVRHEALKETEGRIMQGMSDLRTLIQQLIRPS
jgi:hypothetical protein